MNYNWMGYENFTIHAKMKPFKKPLYNRYGRPDSDKCSQIKRVRNTTECLNE